MSRRSRILVAVVGVVVVAVVGSVVLVQALRPSGSPATQLTPAQLSQRLAGSDPVLINVHVPYLGEIRGTDAFIPYDMIRAGSAGLPAKRRTAIVLYCRSGRMSAIAARTLASLGYTRLYELSGGMDRWSAEGYPLVRTRQAGGA